MPPELKTDLKSIDLQFSTLQARPSNELYPVPSIASHANYTPPRSKLAPVRCSLDLSIQISIDLSSSSEEKGIQKQQQAREAPRRCCFAPRLWLSTRRRHNRCVLIGLHECGRRDRPRCGGLDCAALIRSSR